MYDLGEDSPALRAEISSTLRSLHGAAASIGDSKARYADTGDPRYLQSVQAVLPMFRQQITRLQQLYAMQGEGESPSEFMLVLSETGDWLKDNVVQPVGDTLKAVPKIAGALGNPFVLLAVGLGVFAAFGGTKLLPKRKE
jgi:hypothetical protein